MTARPHKTQPPRVIEQEPKFYELLILYRCASNDRVADEYLKQIAQLVDEKIETEVQQERLHHAKRK